MIKKISSLEIEPSAIKPNPLYWRLQTLFLILAILFLLGVLIGLCGPGLLGKSIVGKPGSELWVEYDYFGRQLSSNDFIIHTQSINSSRNTKITLSRQFLADQYVKEIFPPPINITSNQEKLIYEFSPSTAKIIFRVEPQRFGMLHANVGIEKGNEVSYSQFIYP